MRYNQIGFVVEKDFVGSVLKVDGQISLFCLQGKVLDPFFLFLLPDFMLFGGRR
jgi:hypothetical protein